MKEIKFQAIGGYNLLKQSETTDKYKTEIVLIEKYKKAATKLSYFSHCLIFTKQEERLMCYGVRINDVNEKTGEIIVEGSKISGDIIDIKAYFPCEERITEELSSRYNKEQRSVIIPFKNQEIGKYMYINKKSVIHVEESNNQIGHEMASALENIHQGDYLRILWWFHKHNKKELRNICMVTPPYENAPRSGVFATRSPVRPNPIASTVVKVKSVDKYNHFIEVCGFDGFENTRILQIMSYSSVPIFNNVKVPDWVEHWTNHKIFEETNLDNRIENMTNQKEVAAKHVFIQELEPSNLELNQAGSNEIVIKNASINNLKNISLKIPKEKITVITGVSGSGKSSLAFDTIYYESRKQFMDLIASSVYTFNNLNDSKVEKITGLQPAIAIDQRNLVMNPRSTVGSVSKAGEYLKLLFATIGRRICPYCHEVVPENNVCSKCKAIFFALTPSLFSQNNPDYMCPACKGLGKEMQIDVNLIVEEPNKSILDGASTWWGNLRKHRENPNANWMKGEVLALAEDMNEDLEVPFKELTDDFKKQLFYGSNGREVTLDYVNSNGRKGIITRPVEGAVNIMYRLLKSKNGDKSIKYLEHYLIKKTCSSCNGERLKEEGRLVYVGNKRYPEVVSMNIDNLRDWCHTTYNSLDNVEREKTKSIFIKLLYNLKKIQQVGLGYLSLNRSIPTLSGGEARRLKLSAQFGSGLSNILYIMDEPSKGLHPRDYLMLIRTIEELKKLNNTIIIVEHKKDFIEAGDYLVEIGPEAGKYGGQLIRAEEIRKEGKDNINNVIETHHHKNNLISHRYDLYLQPIDKSVDKDRLLRLTCASTNNLKNIDINIPLSKMICVVGVSGSGKSSLISQTLYPAIQKELNKKTESQGEYKGIECVSNIREVHFVSQSAIGKTSRSNPATYSGVFDLIRDFYSDLDEARKNKLTKEHFSFNSKKGQCPKCKGLGRTVVPMHFMPDISTTCTECKGKKYIGKVLQVKYKGYSIADLLDMEIREVKEIFEDQKNIYTILDMLDKIGVSYIKLGQSATTLSGGEAQRIKLARNLCSGKAKDVLYILDEPTAGLHDKDVKKLLLILKELTNYRATVIVIEHNPIFIKEADYIIEMGPEGGERGGYIVDEGWLNN
ncbi:hypothetical protein SH1V18_21580 [Vallitalea longa]|uniref:UvrABC system protein A n=1 Tax=Vallitalea longa TaxID=2936439 RepID=A0A9W5YC88_9FIRM|nr:TrmO family methyltransferase [Vallitalea longa]GKX29678.1 hypothetical protein SH1V18_21580 [Vallitalea longa]